MEMLRKMYESLRRRDGTIKRMERLIASEDLRIANAKQSRKIAADALVARDAYLHKEAAARVRRALGVKQLPGFAEPAEDPLCTRDRLKLEERRARRIALQTARLIAPSNDAP
jgi:hypothetical protein